MDFFKRVAFKVNEQNLKEQCTIFSEFSLLITLHGTNHYNSCKIQARGNY